MNRRQFVGCAGFAALQAAQDEPQTFVYKKVAGSAIKCDAFGLGGDKPKPVVVFIHGGALITGSRRLSASSPVLRTLLDAGFSVVSIDYRLAPETKLPGIIDDMRDAFRWIRRNAGMLGVDAERIGVCGQSAGGYLALMAGFALDIRPRALVSHYGYGDIAGPWYAKPDPFYLRQPHVTHEEALASVGSTPISELPPNHTRGRFYLYCRQQGLWPKEVTGHDPATEDGWFTPYCPIRNVTGKYPPVMLIHGTADTDVPYEQSKTMAEKLEAAHVEHQLVTVPGGSHGLGNIPAEDRERIYVDAAAFLARRI